MSATRQNVLPRVDEETVHAINIEGRGLPAVCFVIGGEVDVRKTKIESNQHENLSFDLHIPSHLITHSIGKQANKQTRKRKIVRQKSLQGIQYRQIEHSIRNRTERIRRFYHNDKNDKDSKEIYIAKTM
jgi:hypothetical protein